jgi:hypothetical protein
MDLSNLIGAHVQLRGPITKYGVSLQIVLTQDSQIEKIEPAPGRVASSAATRPTTRRAGPAPLDPADHAAVATADGKTVSVEAVVRKIEWSKSGKVLKLAFDTEDFTDADVLLGIAFVAAKPQLTKVLEGDPAQRLAGVKVRLIGTVKRFDKGYEIIFDTAYVRDDGTVELTFKPPK